MKELQFYFTDVFSEKQFGGNQLATFVNCAGLDTQTMQAIAREINFSEITFVTSSSSIDGKWPTRIFTPKEEVPFAGHPMLGTAYILEEKVIKHPQEKLVLALQEIDIVIDRSAIQPHTNGRRWMTQAQPVFGKTLDPKTVAKVLGLLPEELDNDKPILEVSTGFPHIIVPVQNLETLRKVNLSKSHYYTLLNFTWAKNILVYCKQGYEQHQDFAGRVFADFWGIPEDPATGSGAGCLAAYLLHLNDKPADDLTFCLGQGYEVNRPSSLHVAATFDHEKFNIKVGGEVVFVAEGLWSLQKN